MSNYDSLLQMRDQILEYLEKERSINEDSLRAYEDNLVEDDHEVRRMRERERIKLRDRVYKLKRHIEVIKRMYPNVQRRGKKE